jgi:hypothetical protein
MVRSPVFGRWPTIAGFGWPSRTSCGNNLPAETRAGLLSIGLVVQRVLDADEPNFDFLIAINKSIAEGLSAQHVFVHFRHPLRVIEEYQRYQPTVTTTVRHHLLAFALFRQYIEGTKEGT